MIGRDENNEEVSLRVVDRRKFNPDGSLKEGVVLEPELKKPAPEPIKSDEPNPNETPTAEAGSTPEADVDPYEGAYLDDEPGGEEADDIPGAQDPASFVNFLSTLATNAAAALGAVPHPATGQRTLDLDSGKFWIDVLAMLSEKTKGNLHEKEARLLEGLLADLRMQYVTMVRATEEKLKAQAAKKFSGADILGKK
ncbi:MAG: DUF1844 domain-containing protein [Pyrinomonadaceae bacterium]